MFTPTEVVRACRTCGRDQWFPYSEYGAMRLYAVMYCSPACEQEYRDQYPPLDTMLARVLGKSA